MEKKEIINHKIIEMKTNEQKDALLYEVKEYQEDSVYKIENSWKSLFLTYDFDIYELYFSEGCENNIIYPKMEMLFEVFKEPCNEIKICILNDEPYRNIEQSNGYAFSVDENVNTKNKIPILLKNIFKKIKNEFPKRNYNFIHGNLKKWNEKGIFLLNCSLSIEANKPNSHIDIWEDFTNDVITQISNNDNKVIFLLMGKYLQSKKKYILNKPSNIIIECEYPDSIYFFDSDIFINIEKSLGYEFDWSN
jgi:uracil-DNA glycosylase